MTCGQVKSVVMLTVVACRFIETQAERISHGGRQQ